MKKIIKNVLRYGLVALLSFGAYKQLVKNKAKIEADAKLSQERNDVIPVITVQASMATLDGKFNVVGSFAPYKQVAVMSETAGKARQVNFENGSYVKEGNTLISIDNDLMSIQLKTVKTNLAKAENDYNRLNNLLGDGGITQQQLDDAQLAIDNLKNQIETIEKQISMTYVKAPISGTISNKMVEKGSLVTPAMAIANITDISRLKMQVFLTEDQVVTIKKGDSAILTTDLFPEKKISGKVTFIDVNAGTGKRYLVEIEFPNNENQLKAGMTGTAYFDGKGTKSVLSIPRESLVGNLKEAKVYTIDGETAVLKNIEVGSVFGNRIQIKSGLNDGDIVVVSGQINLEDGKKITLATNEN